MKEHINYVIEYIKKLPIDEWEGEKIDEQSMITQRADILFDSGKYDKSELYQLKTIRTDSGQIIGKRWHMILQI